MNMNERTPTVWITMSEKNKDFSDAKNYGEFRVVFVKPIYSDNGNPVDEAIAVMRSYKDGDFILPCGDPMAVGIVMEVALSNSDTNQLNILRWDRRTLKYIPFKLDFSGV
jgi:hypothetical protein